MAELLISNFAFVSNSDVSTWGLKLVIRPTSLKARVDPATALPPLATSRRVDSAGERQQVWYVTVN